MKKFSAAVTLAVLTAIGAIAQDEPSPRNAQTIPEPNNPPQTPKRAKSAPSHEDVLRDAAALTRSGNLSCDVNDARLVGEGTATVNGKPTHVRNFEITCSNSMGYFLVDQSPAPAYGFSCFGAEATRQADVAAGREPQPGCALPDNADLRQAATRVLSRLNHQCVATAVRSIGRDTKANTELTEVRCSGGDGFVIASPLPGAMQTVSASSCPASSARGIACKLSDNGPAPITMETMKQALAQHQVACTVEDSRLIGRQNLSKRHVVEFKCREHPEGLVAFIPLGDATAPFETMSCADAGFKQHIVCSLTQIH